MPHSDSIARCKDDRWFGHGGSLPRDFSQKLLTSNGVLSTVSRVSTTAIVSIRGLTRTFGEVKAVTGVDIDIFESEFITLLGPSGSGKTTVLR